MVSVSTDVDTLVPPFSGVNNQRQVSGAFCWIIDNPLAFA
jgi:hypothetical protein